ncbi:DUF4199 domain-containing protein [Zunongwangia sp.]|uniref:DUF4199 domain-containing protein n=1 Tax=Zunongwangia sp. TaxID=1965325 RepID=UPI003AA9DF4A
MKNKTSITYGIVIAIALCAYFWILNGLLGLSSAAFSFVNCLIMGAGIWFAIKKKKKEQAGLFKYGDGFTTGLVTGFIATTIFTIFFGIYAGEINPDFLDEFLTMWRSDYEISIPIVLFTVFAMGAATTFALTLAFMQLFKKSWNTTEAEKHKLSN